MRPPRKVPTVSTTARAMNGLAIHRHDAGDTPAGDREVGDFRLEQHEDRLRFEHCADRIPVKRAVGLGARRAHRRALARVQRAELDAGAIRRARHRAAHRVDLAHEVALADAADRRVAAHLADRGETLGHEQRARAHPGRRKGRLGAGVAAANDDDVELIHIPSRFRAAMIPKGTSLKGTVTFSFGPSEKVTVPFKSDCPLLSM